MLIDYIEVDVESGDIKEKLKSYNHEILHVRVGEKIKLGSRLCEVIEIMHYPAINEDNHHIEVYVRVLEELPKSFLNEINIKDVLDLFFRK
jgi:predicted phosphohydrolase